MRVCARAYARVTLATLYYGSGVLSNYCIVLYSSNVIMYLYALYVSNVDDANCWFFHTDVTKIQTT